MAINQQALQFWHERFASHLWPTLSALESVTALLPQYKTDGSIMTNRLGAMGPTAILIDDKECVLIGPIAIPPPSGVWIINTRQAPHARADAGPPPSVFRTVLRWMCDPSRRFPLLAVVPSKASVAPFLRLSHSAARMSLCTPDSEGGNLVLDAGRIACLLPACEQIAREVGMSPADVVRALADLRSGQATPRNPKQAQLAQQLHVLSKTHLPRTRSPFPMREEPEYRALQALFSEGATYQW